MLEAGLLRERVAFDRRIEVDDGAGNSRGDWVEQFAASARIRMLRGGEQVIGQRLEGVQPVVITIRSSVAARQVTPDWRARDVRSGRVFTIRAVTPDEKRTFVDLLCDSGVAA